MSAPRVVSLVVGLTLLGCAAGGVVAALQSSGYRATTTVLVQVHGAPAAVPTVAALATGESVVANVASAMHVGESMVRDHLHATVVRGTALIRLEYDDKSRFAALQTVQEEATVLESIVTARIGSAVRTSVADPARAAKLGHPFVRDTLLGGSIGLLLAAIGVGAAGTQRPARRQAVPPVDVSAPAAPEPPARVAQPTAPPRPGRVAELRALVEAHGSEHSPDQVAEWQGYLEAFATQEVDGELPPNLDGLARDVFAPLLEPKPR